MERRLSDRLDIYFWWLMWLLPLIGACICFFMGEANTYTDFSAFISEFSFGFVLDIFTDLEEIIIFSFPQLLKVYASYIVSVELVHILVDFLIFVPRFCHRLAEPDTYYKQGGRK